MSPSIIPLSDRSHDWLRERTRLSPDQFCGPTQVAIAPTAFCYPGRGQGGDALRPDCALLWRNRPRCDPSSDVGLILLVGSCAQIAKRGPGTIGEEVSHFRDFKLDNFPFPHPSRRSQVRVRRNPWLDIAVVQRRDAAYLSGRD